VSRARSAQATLTVGHHVFVAIRDPCQEISNSHWNTRGWTYQEALLSRRRLVFSDTNTYFQCRSTHHFNGLATTDYIPQAFPRGGVGDHMWDIYLRIQEYYIRELSFDTDILNAFSGIFQAFTHRRNYALKPWGRLVDELCDGQPSNLPIGRSYPERPGTVHFYGIPILNGHDTSMALGLAWQVVACCCEDPWSRGDQSTNNLYPSWSWAAFKANQPKSDPGSLWFKHRRNWVGERACVKIQVCHSSGLWMGLDDYLHHKDDYTSFLPLIEISSLTLPGSLWYDELGYVRISTCLQMELTLQLPLQSVLEKVTVICVGCVQEEEVVELVFLVVDAFFDGGYRRVGVSSLRVDTSTFERTSSSMYIGYSGSNIASYDFLLRELCGSASWCEQALILR
jgi:hypothetical protein